MNLLRIKSVLKNLFELGVASVKPGILINSKVSLQDGFIHVNSHSFNITNGKCYVIGFGKAVLNMAYTIENILGSYLHRGMVSIPPGCKVHSSQDFKDSIIEVFEGAEYNIPDKNALYTTSKIIDLVKDLTPNDTVFVLISGGGSALFTKPKPGITLSEKVNLIKLLANVGANIKELNCVRTQLSSVKGGKLAEIIYPAQLISFILSDIVGDPINLIASGPTVECITPIKPLEIIKKYGIENKVSNSVIKALEEGTAINSEVFKSVNNFIIGNNELALNSVALASRNLGFKSIVMSSTVEGSVDSIANRYSHLSQIICAYLSGEKIDLYSKLQMILHDLGIGRSKTEELVNLLHSSHERICLVFGGETVAVVTGSGEGGRNQELAMRASVQLDNLSINNKFMSKFEVVMLFGGTDGIDGPTDAAGAISYRGQTLEATRQGLSPSQYLANSDSYNYYKSLNSAEDLITIGPTGTNVMDLHILIFHPIADNMGASVSAS